MKNEQPVIYMMTNYRNGAIYTGVTKNLIQRVYLHKNKFNEGFTKKYNCTLLVYYELFDSIVNAIIREKQIKNRSRKYKLDLIEGLNPAWRDLYKDILF